MDYKKSAKKAFELFKSFFDYDKNSDWLIDDEIERAKKGVTEFQFSFDIENENDELIKLNFSVTDDGTLNVYNVEIPKSARGLGVITKTFGAIRGIKTVVVWNSINDDAWNAIFSKLGLIDRMKYTS